MWFVVCAQKDLRRTQQQVVAGIEMLKRNDPSSLGSSTPSNGSTTNQGEEWVTTVHDGVSLSYPKNLTVTTYEDEFTGGQMNLRISSSSSRRVGINSIGFQGYELVMRQIDNRQYTDNRTERTSNPQVVRLVEMCDGSTCPDAQYLFTKNGNRYLIEVLHQMTPYQVGLDLNERVISSIN